MYQKFLVYILCPKISILYPFIDTSAYKLNHLGILYNVLELLYLSNSDPYGNFHFSLENGLNANFHFSSKTVFWSKASRSYSSFWDDLTYPGQIYQIRKHISFQFGIFVKFLTKFNLFTLNHPKLLAGREMGSDAKRETL